MITPSDKCSSRRVGAGSLAAAITILAMSACDAGRHDQQGALGVASPDRSGALSVEEIVALGEAGDPAAIAPLVQTLQSGATDAQLRMEAIYALGLIGDVRAVEPLLAILEHDMVARDGFAMAAIPALGQIGDTRAVPVLLEALGNRSDHWLGRELAATALGQIGAPEAVPPLLAAAWQADTRDEAVIALARIRDSRALEVLFSALHDEQEPETTAIARSALIAIGAPSVEYIATIVERDFADFPETAYRHAAIDILAAIGGQRARTLSSSITVD